MNEKIDVAIIGLGGMGRTHAKAAISSPYVDKIYGYDPMPEQRDKAAELGVINTDISDIMSNKDIKLVYIASTNDVHTEQAGLALQSGKAVMCEKPMGVTLEQATELIKIQKTTGGFLQIGFELHYSKLYQLAKKWINDGLIGKPVDCHCRYYCSEFHKKNTWRSENTGSFLIGEKLSHYLDLQRWFIGCEVEEVYSLSAPNVVPYFKHRDNHQINLRFKNGAVSNLNFIMYIGETDHSDPLLEMLEKQSQDGHALTFYIFGTKGAIETDVFNRRIRRWKFSDSPEQLVSEIVESINYKPEEDQQWIHNTHGQNVKIAELVAKGMKPEVSSLDAYKTMQVCFAAEMSEDEKRIIKISELEIYN